MFDKLAYDYKKEFLPVAMLAIVPSAIAVNAVACRSRTSRSFLSTPRPTRPS
jgi:hypothetical protein